MNHQPIRVEVRDATDSSVLVTIDCADGALAAASGSELHGPACAFARTLPSAVAAKAARGGTGVEFLVTEPCYWTPALPFLYDLTLRWTDAAGKQQAVCRKLGFRRLTSRRASLYWESERVVLRGTHASSLYREMIAGVRDAEMALIVPHPNREQCEVADENGVAVVADLRESELDIDYLLRLTIHPAVAIILVDGHQIYSCDVPRISIGSPIAVAICPDDDPDVSAQVSPAWCDVIAVDLESDARPPSWLAHCGKPIVAIRRGRAYADFDEARAACDRLQAELAPEFNLAGYFV